MSKYIDVDEFIHDLYLDADYVINNNLEVKIELPKFAPPNVTTLAIDLIKHAKPADVIPIKWIEKWLSTHHDCLFVTSIMIDDWRKENECWTG